MQPIEHLAKLAGVSLVSGIWQGFILASVVWLCLRIMPKASAAMRFSIWSVVLMLISFLPILEGLLQSHEGDQGGSALPAVFTLDVRWSLVIVSIWAVSSLYRAGTIALHAMRLWSLRRRSLVVVDDAGQSATRMGDGRAVTLCTSEEVDKPSVIGFFAPRILIPTWLFSQLSEVELEQIVLHEMEHLHRGDDWLNLLQKLSLVIFPLNPILIWVERRLCFERELACDDGVLRRTHAPRAYAACLTNLAERGLNRRTLSLALGALGAFRAATRQSELSRRVHRILRRDATLSLRSTRLVTAGLAFGLVACAAVLSHCPQIISFGPAKSQDFTAQIEPLPIQLDRTSHVANVIYAEAGRPHMNLLRASFPVRPTSTPSLRQTLHQRRRHIQNPALRSAVSTGPTRAQTGRVTLSSWTGPSQTKPDQAGSVLTLSAAPSELIRAVFVPHYAAVRTDDGWLIIQL